MEQGQFFTYDALSDEELRAQIAADADDWRAKRDWARRLVRSPFFTEQVEAFLTLSDIETEHPFDAVTQNALGRCYMLQVSAGKDEVRAAGYFHAAAQQGLPEAQYNWGFALWDGIGTTRNRAEASGYFAAAAAHGIAKAQYRYGLALQSGDSGARDLGEAYLWLGRAAAQGEAKALAAMFKLEGEIAANPHLLTPGDVKKIYVAKFKARDTEPA